jgi:hypothetical protein
MAATLLSTPPDKAEHHAVITQLLLFNCETVLSMNESGVWSLFAPADIPTTKLRKQTSGRPTECVTSGWNWMP